MVKLRDRCEEALIQDHVEIMTDEFQPLLDADKIDGMPALSLAWTMLNPRSRANVPLAVPHPQRPGTAAKEV